MFNITDKKFQPIQLLQQLASSGKSGHLHIKSNSVTWKIYLSKGKLQYAYHSLQSLKTIKYFLLRHNFKEISKTISQKSPGVVDNHKSVISIVNQLAEQNLLSASQKIILHKELTMDAIEFFLWLTKAECKWYSDNSFDFGTNNTNTDYNFWHISTLIATLKIRLQLWNKLSPLIQSPYQRPVCVNPSVLNQEVPSGNLSPAVLQKLSKVMQGTTIREIGLVLKQNELKVAQLLLPYIKHEVITLQLPKSPLDRLPLIPSSALKSPATSNTQVRSVATKPITTSVSSKPTTPQVEVSEVESANPINAVTQVQLESEQRTYKIVSIDDSPTMLDLIKNYLGTEKYEIFTLENPMLSLGYLFDKKPDLILMDFSMPGINGNHLCGILRKSPFFKTTPIIMVSGNLNMIDEDKLQSIGITDYLAKPFAKEDLLAIVEKYLKTQS